MLRREKSRQVGTKYPMGLYTACALDLLGVTLSPKHFFFEIETKYLPHIIRKTGNKK